MEQELEYTNCNLCGRDDYRILYKRTVSQEEEKQSDNYRITSNYVYKFGQVVKCSHCGLVYVNPRVKEKEIESIYHDMADEEYNNEMEHRKITFKKALKRIGALKKCGKILDVGCATGLLLDVARERGWDVYGVEISKWAVDCARNKFGLKNIFQGHLKEARLPSGYFDVVVLNDIIEHLTDPGETLAEIRRVLKPDGIICITTPDMDSFLSHLTRSRWWSIMIAHLYYFSRHTLSDMLAKSGFEVIRISTYGRVFSLRYLIVRLKNYSKPLFLFLNFVARRFKLSGKLIYVNFGDQMFVPARTRS